MVGIRTGTAIAIILFSSTVTAKSILVTGSVEAIPPAINTLDTSDKQAFVNEFLLQATESVGSGCLLTGDENQAKADSGDNLICLFEWTSLPSGLTAIGMGVNGNLNEIGNLSLAYEISYFSGSLRDKVLIKSGSISINAIAPLMPSLIRGVTNMSPGVAFDTMDFTSYDRASRFETFTVNADTRPYNQVFTLSDDKGGSANCIVEIGGNTCELDASWVVDIDREKETGTINAMLSMDAENGYFTQNDLNPSEEFIARRDFRAPTSKSLVMHALGADNSTPKNTTVDDVTFSVINNQGKVVVTSPHIGKSGSWWLPKVEALLVPDPDFKPVLPILKSAAGYDLLNIDDTNNQSKNTFDLLANSTPEIQNGKMIYTFDLSGVDDGLYIPEVKVSDTFDNSRSKLYSAVTLDRNAPEIKVFYDKERYISNNNVFMLEGLDIVGIDSFEGGALISSATIDGKLLELNGEHDYLQAVRGSHLNLAPNKTYPLEIKVEDVAGNEHTEIFDVRYMPVQYELKDKDRTYYKNIQSVSLPIYESDGINCTLFESESEIDNGTFGYSNAPKCYLEWTNVPDGFSTKFMSGGNSIQGYPESDATNGENDVAFKVWMKDKNGNKALAAEESYPLDIRTAQDPLVRIDDRSALEEGLYSVQLAGGKFSFASTIGVNADMSIDISDGDKSTLKLQRQNRRYLQSTRMSTLLKAPAGDLWERRIFTFDARYLLDPTIRTQEEFDAIYVPSSRIRIKTTTEGIDTLDSEKEIVKLALGLPIRKSQDMLFDARDMGEWEGYLATTSRDAVTKKTVYTPISGKQKIEGENGVSIFNLDMDQFGFGRYRFVGVAELISPIESYKRKMVSTSRYYKILKSGAINGDVELRKISSQVPFSVGAVFRTAEREDYDSLGEIEWQMQTNGVGPWETIDSGTRLSKRIEEAGHYFIRAIIANKHSKIETTTDVYELLAYEVPEIRFVAPGALYEGEEATVSLYDRGELVDPAQAEIEWSLDGKNWKEGTENYVVTGTGKKVTLWSRMAYKNNELAQKYRYNTYKRSISVRKPAPLRVTAIGPRSIEVGESLELVGKVALPVSSMVSEIGSEWTLPDGTVVNGHELSFSPTKVESDLGYTKLRFAGWAKGFKEQTYAYRDVTVRTVLYEFPEFEMNVSFKTRYSPMVATAVLRKLSLPTIPMKFKYELKKIDGMDITYQFNNRLTFTLLKPGIHQIEGVVTDDRGNTRELIEIVEVLDPPKPELTVNKSFSNSFLRDPLDINLSTRVKFGHPWDKISKVSWYINDVIQDDEVSSNISFDNLIAGSYDIKVKIDSEYGAVAEDVFSLVVNPNKAPVCSISHSQQYSRLKLNAICKDEDGRMKSYRWYFNGQEVDSKSYAVSRSIQNGETSILVKLEGVDDSGDVGAYETTIHIAPR